MTSALRHAVRAGKMRLPSPGALEGPETEAVWVPGQRRDTVNLILDVLSGRGRQRAKCQRVGSSAETHWENRRQERSRPRSERPRGTDSELRKALPRGFPNTGLAKQGLGVCKVPPGDRGTAALASGPGNQHCAAVGP